REAATWRASSSWMRWDESRPSGCQTHQRCEPSRRLRGGPFRAISDRMGKGRLEAFSDGVIAIIITIMVLELKVEHDDGADFAALKHVLSEFLSYVLSFIYVGIYWNNHHHMFQAVERTNGAILWANLHLLFWLSLVPFTTAWMGSNPCAPLPTALYG